MKVNQLPITVIVTVLISKLLGVLFASLVFSINFEVSNINSLFNLNSLADNQSLLLLSSYSDLFMFTIISTALVLNLLIYTNKKKSVLNKNDIEKYFSSQFQNILKIAFKLYGKSIHWLFAIWLTNLYILINTVMGKTYLWIYLLVILLSFSLTLYFYYDLKKEIDLVKKQVFKNQI